MWYTGNLLVHNHVLIIIKINHQQLESVVLCFVEHFKEQRIQVFAGIADVVVSGEVGNHEAFRLHLFLVLLQ